MPHSGSGAVARWLAPGGICLSFVALLVLPGGGAAAPPLAPAGPVFCAGGPVSCLAWSPGGRLLAAASWAYPRGSASAEDGGGRASEVEIWDVAGGALRRLPISQPGIIFSARLTTDDRLVVSSRKETREWDVRLGRLQRRMEHGASAGPLVTVTPDGRQLATAESGRIRLWDPATRECRWQAQGLPMPLTSLALAPDGSRLAAAAGGDTLLLDGRTGAVERRLHHPRWGDVVVAFSPGGERLAVASERGELAMWDLSTGANLWRVRAADTTVRVVAFSPDGLQLGTSAADAAAAQGAASLWDARTGELRGRLVGHRGPIAALAFSPEGRFLATGGHDATVRLWGLPRSAPAAASTGADSPPVPLAAVRSGPARPAPPASGG